MNKKLCILCNYDKLQQISNQVRDSNKYKIFKCKKCNHIQLFPIPTIDEDKKFYDVNLQDQYINDIGTVRRIKRKMMTDNLRRVSLVKKLIPKKAKILELGSGYGIFLEIMKNESYDVVGIDISKQKRGYSKKITKVPVLDIDINKNIPKIGPFHAIVLFHTLEHIIDPIRFLKNAKQMLKKNGKIVIEVPNVKDFHLNVNEEYRKFFWERGHIHYFSPKTLRYVLKKSGFQNIKVIGNQRYSIENFFNWKLTNKPQMENVSYSLPKEIDWIEKHYKKKLEVKLESDTIIAIAQKQ